MSATRKEMTPLAGAFPNAGRAGEAGGGAAGGAAGSAVGCSAGGGGGGGGVAGRTAEEQLRASLELVARWVGGRRHTKPSQKHTAGLRALLKLETG